MRILVVEDEIKTAQYLKRGLTENGFAVDVIHNGRDGLSMALGIDYDLVILDVMLPGIDGWALLSEFRKQKKQTPVIFLTARDRVEDRVKGLHLGADDYLIKPFAFSELLARIHVIRRRGPVQQQDRIVIADLEIDLLAHKVTRADQPVELTQKEFSLLSLLAQRAGQVLSRTMIAEHIWDINFDSNTHVVDVVIRRIRAKIDDPFTVKLIHTIRGVGYVLEERND
jgi:two-component system copper resistance phosphate regulon response regulator CusR